VQPHERRASFGFGSGLLLRGGGGCHELNGCRAAEPPADGAVGTIGAARLRRD
jgi:hypothetical protein